MNSRGTFPRLFRSICIYSFAPPCVLQQSYVRWPVIHPPIPHKTNVGPAVAAATSKHEATLTNHCHAIAHGEDQPEFPCSERNRPVPHEGETDHAVQGCSIRLTLRLPSPSLDFSLCFDLSRSLNTGVHDFLHVVGHVVVGDAPDGTRGVWCGKHAFFG